MTELLTRAQKLQALLKEYEAIRAEILHKLTRMFALTGILGAALAWVLTEAEPSEMRSSTVAVVSLIGAIYLVLSRDICKNKDQLRLTEEKINKLAEDAELMTWERRQERGLICKLFGWNPR